MLITRGHLRDIHHEKVKGETRYHGLSEDTINKLPYILNNPLMIFDSISEKSPNSVCLLSDVLDEDGNPIIVAIKPDGKGRYNGVMIQINEVATMFGKDGFQNYLNSVDEKIDNVLYINKIRTQELLKKGRNYLPTRLSNLKSNTIIHKSRNVVNSNSMQEKIKYSREEDFYTEEEYRNYGWARANGILNAAQNEDYRSKFADAVANKFYYPKSKNGEWIIPVRDSSNPNFKDIENVLVFVKGTIDKPVITSIIEIYEYEESEVDKVRRNIYELERRGIQQKTGEAVGRYYAYSSGIKHYREYIEGRGYNNDNGLGRGNSEETSGFDEVKRSKSATEDTDVKYFPPGEKLRRAIDVPSEIDGEKVRRFARTAAEAPAVSDEIAEDVVSAVENGHFFYEQSSNATLIAAAEALVEDGKAEGKWASVVNGKKPATDLDIAIGEALLVKASNEGDSRTAMKLISEIAIEGTRAGKVVQAMKLLKRMTPEGQVYYLDKTVEKINEARGKKKGEEFNEALRAENRERAAEKALEKAETNEKTKKKKVTDLEKAIEEALLFIN